MKIIFLDFDGVITTPTSHWEISIPHLKRIKKICDETDARLVISSCWQGYNKNVSQWLESVYMKDEPRRVKKFFRKYTYDVSGRFYNEFGNTRGSDIKSWLSRHPEVTSYVIIDDEEDMLDEQLFRFVSTDWVFGIQDREMLLSIDILNDIAPRNPYSVNGRLRFKQRLKNAGYDSDIDDIRKKFWPFPEELN